MEMDGPFKLEIINTHNDPLYWVYFEPIRTNKSPDFWINGFTWDEVSDKEIKKHLDAKTMVDLHSHWEDCADVEQNVWECPQKWNLFHAKRIANLIQSIEENKQIKPADLDLCPEYGIGEVISDGYHRIRALENLGFDGFPVLISGVVDYIEEAEKSGLIKKLP